MIVEKEVPVPARMARATEYVECDLCHRRAPGGDWTACKDGPWPTGAYRVAEVTVSMRLGESYPDDHRFDETELDLCPQCFAEKLIPWFKSLGGTPRERESAS